MPPHQPGFIPGHARHATGAVSKRPRADDEEFDEGDLCPSCGTGVLEELDDVLECSDCGYVIDY
jgi:ribosomal protein S27AE